MVAYAKDSLNTMKLIIQLKGYMSIAEKGKADLVIRAQNGDNLFKGGDGHWTQEELDLYKKKNVTPITINHCFPTINTLSGFQRQNRRDIKIRHRKGASSALAGVYTELTKHTFDTSYGHFITSLCFTRGITTGEDWLKVTIEDDGSPGGHIAIARVSVFNGFNDPTCQDYNINTPRVGSRFFVEREWIIKEEIEAKYPDRKEDLKSPGTHEITGDDDLDRLMGDFYGDEENTDTDDVNFRKYRHRVHTFWWKEFKPAMRWYDRQDDTNRLVWKPKEMTNAKRATKGDIDRFSFTRTTKTILHKSVMIGGLLMEDEENPLGEKIDFLPFIRFSPYFIDGYTFGVLDNLKGPQREVNINRTQATRMINQLANTGWKIKKLVNKVKKNFLQMFGSTPGLVIDESDFGGGVEKIEPNQVSTGHVLLGERSINDIKDISLVNNQMKGTDQSKSASGRALIEKRRQGEQGNEPIMDQLDWTLKMVGQMIVDYIRKTDVYSDEEIRAVVDDSKLIDADAMAAAEERFALSPEVQEPNGKLMAIMRPEDQQQVMMAQQQYVQKMEESWGPVVRLEAQDMFLEQLRSDDKGVYGIKVDLSPEAPTIKMANLIELSEIAERYPDRIPIEVFIKNSGLTNKDEIAAEIEKYNQQMVAMQGPALAQGVA